MISLKNVEFSYSHQAPFLKLEELKLMAGEKVFLYGPSGCGKSTLLNILAGVIKPKTGSLSIRDQDIFSLSASKRDQFRGENIGYIFQSFNLLPFLTVRENIELTSLITKKRKSDQVQFEAITKTLKLSSLLGKKSYALSVGEQQRVAVARALYGNPSIVIADEPTSALDEEVSAEFMELLMLLHQEKKFLLLFVSHDKRLMKYFDRVISLPEINLARSGQ